jgi:hypothetical protein
MRILKHLLIGSTAAFSRGAFAAQGIPGTDAQQSIQDTGVSAIWILANISYAGMRAQNNPMAGWRTLSFLFGLPGTLITYFAVAEGGERAYGIEMPKKKQGVQAATGHEGGLVIPDGESGIRPGSK